LIKRISAVTAALALATVGFIVPAQAATTEADCGTAGAFCVGLVTDLGKVDDKSFNQSAWEGAKAGAAKAGGFAKYIETTDSKDYAKNMALFADKGYNVIVTVGFLMGDATAAAAVKYPKIKFIGVDQFNASTATNNTGLIFDEDKAGFLAGYLAAYLTKTNKVGAVFGMKEVLPVRKFGEGYENGIAYGAKERSKKIKSTVVYHAAGDNAFSDPAWGATTANQLLTQGYDIIFGAGGSTGNGALGKVAQKAGAFCIGVDTDQYLTVPEAKACIVTSAEKKLTLGVSTLIAQAKAGTIKGGNFTGQVGLSPFHDLDSKVPAVVKVRLKKVTTGILAGSISTGFKG
jgi:basic membrane protein A